MVLDGGSNGDGRPRWAGVHHLALGDTLALRLGPLSLWLGRLSHEWRLSVRDGTDSMDASLAIEPITGPWEPEPEPEVRTYRFAGVAAREEIRLGPLLADRPIVVRPRPSLLVAPKDRVTLFVSTPLWVAVGTPDPPRTWIEVPTWRPSDTWFGADTRRGRLCYAGHTAARLDLDNVARRAHRAITRVTVANDAHDAFEVERLAIPAPHLALYEAADGTFWTQGLTASRDRNGVFGGVDLDAGPPQEAVDAARVASARETGTPTVLQRAWQALLG